MKRKSVKIIISFLCVFLLLSAQLCLSACGNNTDSSTEESDGKNDPGDAESTDDYERDESGNNRPDDISPEAESNESVPGTSADPVQVISPGYVLYENELFTTEVPEGWEIQKTKIQYFYDTILEPHENKSIWSSIIINGGGYKDGDVEALRDDYIKTGLTINYYEISITGQSATVIERGGGGLGLSMRDMYSEAPNGQRFTLHFNCPDNGEAFSFKAIQEPMDHFLNCLRWKSGESEHANPMPTQSTISSPSESEPYFDSVEIWDFKGFEGMNREDLKERYGDPDSDDGSVMTYDSVSWNGWIGNMRFFFDSPAEDCKTNCASWTTSGDEGIFNELIDTLQAEGSPGETSSPKDGQIEKAFIIDGFELIAGNEDSSNGKWTYLFARLHSS